MPKKNNSDQGPKQVKFQLVAPHAKSVYLAGDFNDWNPSSLPLKSNKKTGVWSGQLKLQPGRHQYKFVVDDTWSTDPNCSTAEWNDLGTQNSIIEV